MKKKLKLILLSMIILLVTSCAKENLECKIHEKNNTEIFNELTYLYSLEESLETSVKITILELKLKENKSYIKCN